MTVAPRFAEYSHMEPAFLQPCRAAPRLGRWRHRGSRASGCGVSGAVNAARLAFGLTKTETNGRWFAESTSHRGAMVQRPKNGLLASLPASEWIEVQRLCEPVKLPLGRVLYEPRGPFDYVYFPETAIISNVAPLKTGRTAETSTTGREGLVNVGAIMGDHQSLHRAVVHVSGDGTRISFREFQELQARLPAFRRKLNAYSRAFLAQVMQSVACNASHTLRQRCARWLLKCHDRVDGDELRLTQQFLAEMLVVSRVAVNAELKRFQRLQVLTYSRGIITILDRRFLERTSCECYRAIRREYDRLLPGSFTK
jgi:CRP-like cAMP-binding protein